MDAVTKGTKAHRAPQAGPKAEKRKKADKKKRGLSVDKVNHKARARGERAGPKQRRAASLWQSC